MLEKEVCRTKSEGEESYLVDHHDCKEVADSGEDETIHVMGNAFADGLAESVDKYLAYDEEENAEGDVTQRPSVLKCSGDEQNLHDDVDSEEDCVEDVKNDKEANSVVRAETTPALEGQDADEESDGEHCSRADSKQPDAQEGSIFI